MRKFATFLMFLLLISFSSNANSSAPEEFADRISTIVKADNLDYAKVNKEITNLSDEISTGKVSIEETVPYIKNLSILRSKVSEIKDDLESNSLVVQRRITALGEVPVEGKETALIAKQRKEFAKDLSEVKSKIVETDLIMTKIYEVESIVLNIRNKRLLNDILAKQESLVYPKNFYSGIKVLTIFSYDILKSPMNWYAGLNQTEKELAKQMTTPVLGSLFAGLIIAFFLNIFIRKKFGYSYKKDSEVPDYNTKIMAAIATAIAYGLVPLSVLGAFLLWLASAPILLNSFFGICVDNLLLCLLYMFLLQAVVRVIFAPSNSNWRLIEVADVKARNIGNALLVAIILIISVLFFQLVAVKTSASLELIYFLGLIASAIKSFSIVYVVYKSFSHNNYDFHSESHDDEEMSISTKLVLLTALLAITTFSIAVYGYVSLAEFILNKLIYSSFVFIACYILVKTFNEIIGYIISFRFWRLYLKINLKFMKSVGTTLKLVMSPLMFLFSILVVLSIWGVSVDLMIENIKRFLTGFYIGGIKISITSILLSITVFFTSLAIFKALRRSLTAGVLSKLDIDEGTRSTLISSLGFLGVLCSFIFAIITIGGNLTNLALIAGALSFGIGLGLQNIVTNCVSGIIILFERPIKVGDWVRIANEEGIVKQISIRATEIQSFDKSSVIIPNGTILSSNVTNLTHRNKQSRFVIPVGVGYDSDVKQVREILLNCAKSNKKVLASPAPSVGFKTLGDFSLNFELRCYVSDVMNRGDTQGEVMEAILKKLNSAGIEIPFPRSVVELKKV